MCDLLEKGETTGDQILDWALSGDYPYQECEQSARRVYTYLQEHLEDYFFFLDSDHYWKLHVGKIASPPLHLAEGRLGINVVDGTLVEKKVRSYITEPPLVIKLAVDEERSQPFIEGLITFGPHQYENGVLESTHAPFSDDDFHYVLGAGEKNVIVYLAKRKIIPEATKECLETLLSK